MRYEVDISPRAEREIDRLPKRVQQRIHAHLVLLRDDPRPTGVQQVVGDEGFYRIRVGDYRVIYSIEDERLVILVVKVGHRRDVYRRI